MEQTSWGSTLFPRENSLDIIHVYRYIFSIVSMVNAYTVLFDALLLQ